MELTNSWVRDGKISKKHLKQIEETIQNLGNMKEQIEIASPVQLNCPNPSSMSSKLSPKEVMVNKRMQNI